MEKNMTENKRILVVDDLPKEREEAKRVCEEYGFDVTLAEDYEGAMTALHSGTQFYAVLTDLFMPRKTGSKDRSLGWDLLEEGKECGKINLGRYDEIIKDAAEDPNGLYARELAQVRALPNYPHLKAGALSFLGGNCWDYKLGIWREVAQKALEESPANQALGILVAREAAKIIPSLNKLVNSRDLPARIVSSEHHHGTLVEGYSKLPISDDCGRMSYLMVDEVNRLEVTGAKPWSAVFTEEHHRIMPEKHEQ